MELILTASMVVGIVAVTAIALTLVAVASGKM